jgi:hypothetical protein
MYKYICISIYVLHCIAIHVKAADDMLVLAYNIYWFDALDVANDTS